MNKNLLKLISNYYYGKIKLFDFETELIKLSNDSLSEQAADLIAELQDNIGYTAIGELTEEDKQNGLISESNLKEKLQKYLQ